MTPPISNDHGRLGELLQQAGLLTPEQVTRVAAVQAEQGLRFGEAAIRLGLLTEEQIRTVLAQQFRYAISASPQSGVSPMLSIAHAPFGPEAEAIRKIRTQLSLHFGDQRRIAFAVVSPDDGEGKSYLAASLAIAFSQAGLRTLYIDADMRGPDRPSLLGVQQATGLSTMLAGRAEAEASPPLPDFPLLQVIDRGPRPPNPTEILGTLALRQLMHALDQRIDAFVVDTPSATLSADAQIIAGQVGACVLVARQHRSSLKAMRAATGQLRSAGVEILGAVYNEYAGARGASGWKPGLRSRSA